MMPSDPTANATPACAGSVATLADVEFRVTFQVAALSSDSNTPSAVVRYRRVGACGSITIARTKAFVRSAPPFAAVHVSPPSVLLMTPPEFQAANTFSGFFGSQAID